MYIPPLLLLAHQFTVGTLGGDRGRVRAKLGYLWAITMDHIIVHNVHPKSLCAPARSFPAPPCSFCAATLPTVCGTIITLGRVAQSVDLKYPSTKVCSPHEGTGTARCFSVDGLVTLSPALTDDGVENASATMTRTARHLNQDTWYRQYPIPIPIAAPTTLDLAG